MEFPARRKAHVRGNGRIALIDTGSLSQRRLIMDRLTTHDLTPVEVTDVLLTHPRRLGRPPDARP